MWERIKLASRMNEPQSFAVWYMTLGTVVALATSHNRFASWVYVLACFFWPTMAFLINWFHPLPGEDETKAVELKAERYYENLDGVEPTTIDFSSLKGEIVYARLILGDNHFENMTWRVAELVEAEPHQVLVKFLYNGVYQFLWCPHSRVAVTLHLVSDFTKKKQAEELKAQNKVVDDLMEI